jgi:hypothetical protein
MKESKMENWEQFDIQGMIIDEPVLELSLDGLALQTGQNKMPRRYEKIEHLGCPFFVDPDLWKFCKQEILNELSQEEKEDEN